MAAKLSLYTQRSWLSPGQKHIPLLFPAWGNPETDSNDPDFGRFDELCRNGAGLYSLAASGAEAELYVLPYEFSFEERPLKQAIAVAEEAAKLNKRLLVFFNSDLQDEIPIPNAVVFRTSFTRSERARNVFAMPGWSIDFQKLHHDKGLLKPRPARPLLGYCGYVDYLFPGDALYWKGMYMDLTGKAKPMHKTGPRLRGRLVRKLRSDKRIDTNFVIRKGFWAEGMDRKQARMDYVRNMFDSDYALVTRGGGNFSYRLYEVLSCGRVPFFLDTDCVLPFDHLVDWKQYMVWLDESEMDKAGDKLTAFHNGLSSERFTELRKECRKLYEEYICPEGFFRNLHKCL